MVGSGTRQAGALLVGAALCAALWGCSRDRDEVTESPDASAPAVVEEQEPTPVLEAGDVVAFDLRLPAGAETVVDDPRMKSFRLEAPFASALDYVRALVPEGSEAVEGRSHRFRLDARGLTVHVFPEGASVRIAMLLDDSSERAGRPPHAASAEADAQEASGDAGERDGPRRIVMRDQDGVHEAGSRRVSGAAAQRRDSERVQLEGPDDTLSEMIHVPPSYLSSLPRDRDGYLRLRPSQEQLRRHPTIDGRAPTFFVPSNPHAGF